MRALLWPQPLLCDCVALHSCQRRPKGLPEEVLALYADRCYTIPMSNPHIRSLNLAMSAGIVLYEALHQQQAALTVKD